MALGTIHSQLANTATGELRVASGHQLLLTAAGSTNSGQIKLLGGTVEFSENFTNNAGGFISGHGTLDFQGGMTNQGVMAFATGTDISGDINNTGTGQIIATGSATSVFFDDIVHNGTEIRASAGSSIVYFGAISGSGPFTGPGTHTFEGNLLPGNSAGVMSFEGDVVFGPFSTLTMEIGGTTQGTEFDFLDVAGDIALSGTLDLQFVDSFLPTAGDTFEIIAAASVIDTFDTVNLPALPGGLLWFVNYGATSVELVTTFGADFDEDGEVDDLDLAAWESGLGSDSAVHTDGDANADTFVNGFDFLAWQRQFGVGGAPLAAATSVPEPSACLLAVFGLVTLLVSRRCNTLGDR